MNLQKITDDTYVIENRTNIGIYLIENDAYLIDSGIDSDTGKKILKILNEQNWHLKAILNTHFHADHIGGNNYLQTKTNCLITSSPKENIFIENPELELLTLYGAKEPKQMQTKFLLAKKSLTQDFQIPLEIIPLPGHTMHMIGFKTKENVYFLGDALAGEEAINKYKIFFLTDVTQYLETLNFLKTLKGIFVISHHQITNDITNLINLNEQTIDEISKEIITICQKNETFENILTKIFNCYNMIMNITQYYLISCTLKAYLTYLISNQKIEIIFQNNQMLYHSL